jgi:hypothetical protein
MDTILSYIAMPYIFEVAACDVKSRQPDFITKKPLPRVTKAKGAASSMVYSSDAMV